MRRPVLLLYIILSLYKLLAQDLELSGSHEEILKNILKMNLLVKIYKNSEDAGWQTEISKITIPGREVIVKLEGKDIQVYGTFTPYQFQGHLMLLAQCQVIILPPAAKTKRYINSVKIISITLGEKLYFFPLGQKEDTKQTEEYNLELEIEILPYLQQNGEIPDPGDSSAEEEIPIL